MTRRRLLTELDVGEPNLVIDPRPLCWPLVYRHLGFNQGCHVFHAPGCQARDQLMVVDKCRRALVTHAGAGRGGHTHTAIRAHLVRFELEHMAQVPQQFFTAQHAVGDVVTEQHPVLAHRLAVKETVETRHPFHVRQ